MNIHSWISEWSSWLWPNVAAHLWETALFVGLLALSVRLLKRAPASTRYWFWLLAAVKLVVPSVLIGMAGIGNPYWGTNLIPSAPGTINPWGANFRPGKTRL